MKIELRGAEKGNMKVVVVGKGEKKMVYET